MSAPKIVSSPFVTRGFNTDFEGIIAVTPWVLCAGTNTLRFVRKVSGSTGSPVSDVAYQFAAVKTSQPGDWNLASDTDTGDNWKVSNVDISSTTDQMWVRGGLHMAGDDTNAENLEAQVRMMTDGTGKIIGARTLELPSNYANDYNSFTIASGVPVLGASALMFGFDMVAASSTSATLWASHRLYAGNPRQGGSWTNTAQGTITDDEKVWNSGLGLRLGNRQLA